MFVLCSVVASLLVSLCHREPSVRAAALQCTKTLRRAAKDHPFAGLMKKLIKQEEEILADSAHAQQVTTTLDFIVTRSFIAQVSYFVLS